MFLRGLCEPRLRRLCDAVGLSDRQVEILVLTYCKRLYIAGVSMALDMSERVVWEEKKLALQKICDFADHFPAEYQRL